MRQNAVSYTHLDVYKRQVLGISQNLSSDDIQVSENQIRNSIKRKIRDYIEYKGSKKTGGYFIKN